MEREIATFFLKFFLGLLGLALSVYFVRWALRINEIVSGLTEIKEELRLLRHQGGSGG